MHHTNSRNLESIGTAGESQVNFPWVKFTEFIMDGKCRKVPKKRFRLRECSNSERLKESKAELIKLVLPVQALYASLICGGRKYFK